MKIKRNKPLNSAWMGVIWLLAAVVAAFVIGLLVLALIGTPFGGLTPPGTLKGLNADAPVSTFTPTPEN